MPRTCTPSRRKASTCTTPMKPVPTTAARSPLLGRASIGWSQGAPGCDDLAQLASAGLSLRGIGKAHEARARVRPFEVRELARDPRSTIEHDGGLLLVADLHHGGKVAAVIAERESAVLHVLGHSPVSAKDDLAYLVHRRLGRRLLLGEPPLDLRGRLHEGYGLALLPGSHDRLCAGTHLLMN